MKQNQRITTKNTISLKTGLIAGISVAFLAGLILLIINVGDAEKSQGGQTKNFTTKKDGPWRGAFNWNGKGWPKKSTHNATIAHDITVDKKTPTVNDLDFQNGGSVNIKSGQRLTVTGTLDLNNGSIDASQGDLILSSGASIKNMDGTNFTGSYSVKDGSGIVDSSVFYLSASYGNTKVAIHDYQSSSCNFSVSYYEKDPQSASSIPNNSVLSTKELKHISSNEYFEITKSGCSNNGARVTLFWDQNNPTHFSNLASKQELVIAHHDGNGWDTAGTDADGSLSTEGHITSNKITSFSPFTFGSNSTNSPLPVELKSFDVKSINGGVKLEWATASETNNSHFLVQRKSQQSEKGFEKVTKIQGHGTTTDPQTYEYKDNISLSGKAYYRLKQVDFDGSHEYSNIQAVSPNQSESALENFQIKQIAPNPFQSRFKVTFELGKARDVQLSLRNMSGNKVLERSIKGKGGTNEFRFNQGGQLQKGNYILTLQTHDKEVSEKLIKR